MHGQRVGYIRVSSFDQNPERQLEHVAVDRVFTDRASGKDTRRPVLESLLAFVREGGSRECSIRIKYSRTGGFRHP